MSSADFAIRLARLEDFGPAAALFERVATATMPWAPAGLFTAETFLRDAAEETVWVAAADGRVIGLAALQVAGSFLHSLYVEAAWRGRGVGLALLEMAAEFAPAPLSLKVEALNQAARRFYARRGFCEVERGEASGSIWLRLSR